MAVRPGIGVLEYLDYDGNVTHRDEWTVAIVGRQDWAELGAHTAIPYRYGYANACYVQQSGAVANTGIEIAEATSEGWLLLDSGSDPVPSLGFSYYLADIGNPDYYHRFAEAVFDDADAAGLTGVFLDNVDIDYHNLTGNVNIPINPRTSLAYTQADWAADSADAYAYIGEYLQSRSMYLGGNANAFIAGNSASNTGALTKTWWDMLTYSGGFRNGQGVFDHYMVERWMRTTKSGADVNRLSLTTAFYHHWDSWQSLVAYAQGKSSHFIAYDDTAHDGVTTAVASRYNRASFLLDWDGGDGVAIFKVSPADPWLASMSDDLGMPTGASSSVATNVDRRDFDNGYVIVNHSTADVTISGHAIPSGDAVIALDATPDPATNDDFADALALTGLSDSAGPLDATDATGEVGEAVSVAAAGDGPFQTVWFVWTAPVDGELTIDLTDSDFYSEGGPDGVVAVWTGSVLASLVEHDSWLVSPGSPSQTTEVVGGTTYHIQVDSFGTSDPMIVAIDISLGAPTLETPAGVCIAFPSTALEPSPAWVRLD